MFTKKGAILLNNPKKLYTQRKVKHKPSDHSLLSFMKNKKYVTYARDIFVRMKIMKKNLNFAIKSEIIVITAENLEELIIVFAI